MSGLKQTGPCPCGSGLKFSRCCGRQRGPTKAQLQRDFVAYHGRQAAAVLLNLPPDDVNPIFEELYERAEIDLGLTITPPPRIGSHLERLYDAVRADDQDRADAVIPLILYRLGSPANRARLAREIIMRRDSGELDLLLACAAIVDLATGSPYLLRACLIHTARVHTGKATARRREHGRRNDGPSSGGSQDAIP